MRRSISSSTSREIAAQSSAYYMDGMAPYSVQSQCPRDSQLTYQRRPIFQALWNFHDTADIKLNMKSIQHSYPSVTNSLPIAAYNQTPVVVFIGY